MRVRTPLLAVLLLLTPIDSATSQAPTLGVPSGEPQSMPRRVIIDTDPGGDDALAILLALNSPEIRVEAVTVVHGNTTGQQGLTNALRLISLAGYDDVRIAGGALRPLAQKSMTAEFIHGRNGLFEVELPESRIKADARFAPDLIIELIRNYPRQVTIITLGPLTNLGLAIAKDPDIVPLVKEVILMGGSLSGGNATGAAEANIHGDPEAARAVFRAGWPLTMVGLDVTRRARFTRAHLERLAKTRGPQNDVAIQLLHAAFVKFGGEHLELHDPLAVGVLIDRSIIKSEDSLIDVETKGELTRGETVNVRGAAQFEEREGRLSLIGFSPATPNVKVAMKVEPERFLELFITRIAGK